jgi:hypothetical protein
MVRSVQTVHLSCTRWASGSVLTKDNKLTGRGCRSTSDEIEASVGQDDVLTGSKTLPALPYILGIGYSLLAGGPMPCPDPVSPVTPAADIVAAAAGGTSRGVAASSSRTVASMAGSKTPGYTTPSGAIAVGRHDWRGRTEKRLTSGGGIGSDPIRALDLAFQPLPRCKRCGVKACPTA